MTTASFSIDGYSTRRERKKKTYRLNVEAELADGVPPERELARAAAGRDRVQPGNDLRDLVRLAVPPLNRDALA